MKKILKIAKFILGIFFAIEAITGPIILIMKPEIRSTTSNIISTIALSITFFVLAYFCLRPSKKKN